MASILAQLQENLRFNPQLKTHIENAALSEEIEYCSSKCPLAETFGETQVVRSEHHQWGDSPF